MLKRYPVRRHCVLDHTDIVDELMGAVQSMPTAARRRWRCTASSRSSSRLKWLTRLTRRQRLTRRMAARSDRLSGASVYRRCSYRLRILFLAIFKPSMFIALAFKERRHTNTSVTVPAIVTTLESG